MGYESKIYIIKGSMLDTVYAEDGRKAYAEIIATVDMSKQPSLHKFFEDNGKESTHYIYAEDGNTVIENDRYDKPLLEVPVREVLAFMYNQASQNLLNNRQSYRRDKLLISILESLVNSGQWEVDCIYCLHYGH